MAAVQSGLGQCTDGNNEPATEVNSPPFERRIEREIRRCRIIKATISVTALDGRWS